MHDGSSRLGTKFETCIMMPVGVLQLEYQRLSFEYVQPQLQGASCVLKLSGLNEIWEKQQAAINAEEVHGP